MDEQTFVTYLEAQKKWEAYMKDQGYRRVIILEGPHSGWRWVKDNEDGSVALYQPEDNDV
jgi:hypothetical protein